MKLPVDELDEIQTPATSKTSFSLDDDQPVTASAAADKALTYSLDDDDNIGEEYSRTGGGADYLKVNDGQVVRAAFIPKSFVAADFVHYHPNVGYCRCNSTRQGGNITKKALCCTTLGDAKPRRALYVFTYNGADSKTGKLGNDPSVSVKILRASAAMWKDIKRVIDEDSTFYSHDFIFGKDPSEKQLQVGIASHKNPPAWMGNKDTNLETAQTTLANQTSLLKALGKTMSDAEIEQVLKGGAAPKGSLAQME